jgi:hypothetical protein
MLDSPRRLRGAFLIISCRIICLFLCNLSLRPRGLHFQAYSFPLRRRYVTPFPRRFRRTFSLIAVVKLRAHLRNLLIDRIR